MNHLKFNKILKVSQAGRACDLLAHTTGLSRSAIKRAMNFGAVWHQRGKSKQRRIRRATFESKPGDRLSIYYDEAILSKPVPGAVCLKDHRRYSIWFKPAGLLTQGSRYGDHCALTRQAEHHFTPKRSVYVVHRIDQETAGLVILCHDKTAAAHFSEMFRCRTIKKGYDVLVRGDLRVAGFEGEITLPLDGRQACTRYRWISYDRERNESRAAVEIITGRTHQIRRHFDMIGHPVVGDPRYGVGNKNRSGLKLVATSLSFACPFDKRPVSFEIDPDRPPASYPQNPD